MPIHFDPHRVVDHTEFLEGGGEAQPDPAPAAFGRFPFMRQNNAIIRIDFLAMENPDSFIPVLPCGIFHQSHHGSGQGLRGSAGGSDRDHFRPFHMGCLSSREPAEGPADFWNFIRNERIVRAIPSNLPIVEGRLRRESRATLTSSSISA
jgi:hypothetical protein